MLCRLHAPGVIEKILNLRGRKQTIIAKNCPMRAKSLER